MNLRNEIDVSDLDQSKVEGLVKSYFISSGFKPTGKSDLSWTFRRGSITQNMYTMNPLKWKSKIKIDIVDTKLIAYAQVSTIGQLVTKSEQQMWLSFLDNLETYVFGNPEVLNTNKNELNKVKRSSLQHLIVMFKGALITFFPALFIASLFDRPSIAIFAAISGGLASFQQSLKKAKTHPNTK